MARKVEKKKRKKQIKWLDRLKKSPQIKAIVNCMKAGISAIGAFFLQRMTELKENKLYSLALIWLIIRMEGIHSKINWLADGIAGSFITLYLNGIMIASDIAIKLEEALNILKGFPS